MNSKPTQCGVCQLRERGQGYARGSGTGSNHVLLLGEALGAREAVIGTPFVGDAGAQLSRTLQRVQSSRNDFRVDNVVRCRPPNNWLEGAPWESDAVLNCTAYFEEELKRYDPSVIVPMGNVPLNFLLGFKGIEDKRGYVYSCVVGGKRRHVVPTYHPSFIMRGNQNLTDVQAIDIKRAIRVVANGYKEPAVKYIQYPTGYDIKDFIAQSAPYHGNFLAADIETPYSGATTEDEYGEILDTEILRISFAYAPGHAITIPWTNGNFELIQEILSLPFSHTVFWNQEFDVPRLQSKGIMLGKTLDAMYMWHFLQSDLPKGLGYVATFFTEFTEWKSLSDSMPEYYSCKDSDATIQCAAKIRELLQKQSRYDSFIRHYVELQPYVVQMARSGVLIDSGQQQKFRGEIDQELRRIDDEIQSGIPMPIRPFKCRRKVPADALLGGPVDNAGDGGVWDCDDNGEWGIRLPFLYNSPKQVVEYMRYRGHPVPTNYKTGRSTTGAAEIEKLADKYPDDPLYPWILSAREFRKIKGQYIDGYNPDPDGRVRTHFNRKPSTWRFNSEDPNVQNVLRRSNLAAEYRKQFVAAPGYKLVELDYKAVEAVLTGYYAQDYDYMRAAKLGVHSILMSHVLKKPADLYKSDEDLKGYLGELKHADEALYSACKMIVHLSNYAGSPRRIRIEHPDLFENVKAAADLQNLYYGTIAKRIRLWQQKTMQTAHDQHYLQNAYGYRHYFWDVFHYNGQQLEWGTDAKRSLAFLPQSTAAGLLCEALLRIHDNHPELYKMLRWIIHDSIVAEVPDDAYFEQNVYILKGCMEAPQPLLGGLSVEVEVKAGYNWGQMMEIKI